ncbi:MAG: DUF975 family protein [Oscillospiraceae bacterium]|nr:DUF975 family protein [Oscillospiraceae bacterium]
MDIATIKKQAKAVIAARRKPILIAGALFVALSLLLFYLSARLLLPPTAQLQELSQRMAERILAGDSSGAMKIYDSIQPSTMESLVSRLLGYLQAVVGFGFLLLLFRAMRGDEVYPSMLMDGFGRFFKVLLLEILLGLILSLCFWALIVPGFIATYSYGMARYLLIANPESGVLDCLRGSRLRMRGYRMDLFRLDLSFLGWALLLLVPIVNIAAAVWILPYWKCSRLLFCEAVCASQPAPPRPESGEDRFL